MPSILRMSQMQTLHSVTKINRGSVVCKLLVIQQLIIIHGVCCVRMHKRKCCQTGFVTNTEHSQTYLEERIKGNRFLEFILLVCAYVFSVLLMICQSFAD